MSRKSGSSATPLMLPVGMASACCGSVSRNVPVPRQLWRRRRSEVGSVSTRARLADWLARVPGVGFGTSEPGIGDGLCGLRLRRCDGAAGAHGPGLSPVPLPGLRQAVQRAQWWPAEPHPLPLGRDRPGGAVAASSSCWLLGTPRAVLARSSSRGSNPADVGPYLERARPCGAVLAGGGVVAAEVEKVADLT